MGRGSSKSKSVISYWYPIKNAEQLTFEGQRIIVPVPQQGHILYQGRLLCKQSMERLKGECKAKNQRTVSVRIPGVSLCPICQEGYKETKGLDWERWVNPPPLKHEATKIQINPQLLEVVNVEEQQTVVLAEPSQESKNVGESPKENQTGLLLPGQH